MKPCTTPAGVAVALLLTTSAAVAQSLDEVAYRVHITDYPRLAGELLAINEWCTKTEIPAIERLLAEILDSELRDFLLTITRTAEDLEEALATYRESRQSSAAELAQVDQVGAEMLGPRCVSHRDDVTVFQKRLRLAKEPGRADAPPWGPGFRYFDMNDEEAVAAARRRIEAQHVRSERLEAQREATARDAYDAMASMVGPIKDKVRRNWNRPTGVPSGLSVTTQIRVTRSGEVISVDPVESSGDQLFDDSVVRAILKASPLPMPSDPRFYEFISSFQFRFSPGR